jgi:hypothetical protein
MTGMHRAEGPRASERRLPSHFESGTSSSFHVARLRTLPISFQPTFPKPKHTPEPNRHRRRLGSRGQPLRAVKMSAPAATEAMTADTTPVAKGTLEAKVVIEIPSSPDSTEGGAKWSSRNRARKWSAPPIDLDVEIEMWTPREKRRLEEDCQILAGDPLAEAVVVPAAAPAAGNDDIAVVAERGKVRAPRAFFIHFACGGPVRWPRFFGSEIRHLFVSYGRWRVEIIPIRGLLAPRIPLTPLLTNATVTWYCDANPVHFLSFRSSCGWQNNLFCVWVHCIHLSLGG